MRGRKLMEFSTENGLAPLCLLLFTLALRRDLTTHAHSQAPLPNHNIRFIHNHLLIPRSFEYQNKAPYQRNVFWTKKRVAIPRNPYNLSSPGYDRPMTADERAREALISQHQTAVDQRPDAEKAAYFVRAVASIAASSVVIDNNYNSFLSGYLQLVRARVDDRLPRAEYNFIQNSLRELEQLAQRDFDARRDTGALADLA